MGLLGIIFPVEYGGAGLGYVEYVVALEELARVDGSVALTVSAHTSLCTNHIYRFGHEEQRRRYVPALARGEKLGCWSLTEPEAGSDAGGTRSVAQRRDGGWLLDGAKTFTTNGRHADVCVAMAVTDRAKGRRASRRSSSRRERPASGRARRRTSWACVPATPPRWSSPNAACHPKA